MTDGDILNDRYELRGKLGQGGQGITRLAFDRQTEREVVVKELHVEHLDDWKKLELFEREGEALQSLDHPAIPDYIDSFHVEDGDSSRLYLVQEYVEGVNLSEALEDGLRFTEEEAVAFLEELLEILSYTHSLEPPIIHRDIKPSNVMRRTSGELVLVDFGAAREILDGQTEGSTVVGTTGYMPLEQLMGDALPATDLFALGATAIHILSHVHPADMEVLYLKMQFRNDVAVSDRLEDFLEKLVEPHAEDRFQSADEALEALRSPEPVYIFGESAPPSRERGPKRRSVGPMPRGWSRDFDGGDIVLHRKTSGLGNGGKFLAFVFMVGSSIVAAFFGFIMSLMLLDGLTSPIGPSGDYWSILLFVTVPTLVGFGIAAFLARQLLAFEEFRLTPTSVIYRKGVPLWTESQVMDLSDIETVDVLEPSQSMGRRGLKVTLDFEEREFSKLGGEQAVNWVRDEVLQHVETERS